MWPILDTKLARFRELETLLGDPAVATDQVRFTQVAKEHGSLSKVIKPYIEFQQVETAIKQSEELLAAESDPDMRAMVEEELAQLRPRYDALKARIEDLLLVDPSEDFDSLIMEIRAGTGGDEAALFAGDLYEMYVRFARVQGWGVDELSTSPGEAGGFKEVVFTVKGEGAYQSLRFESGGHRVQRVPKTETQGRIHTSLATVGVMPEPDEVQVEIKPADLIIETMRAGGAGGQHVNKTESAIRIWYKQGTPDQIEVKCQDGRSQHKNKDQAMRVLRSRVFEAQQAKAHRERAEMRRTLIGGGDRSERIRTYNFPDGRITDHRIGLTVYKLADILAGSLEHLVDPMKEHDKKERLAQAK
ncbi:peptide chain release factor 1 [Fimbriiglobus ruber]|uniref:Peptide chain release factor 1 n=1 Tax=Fimbriiglobus ruber TaxID=1908690 RepID=A0A225DXW1_9BACT|nr:peptide chain release factor 1 [Fimbriiglobus ruber]OWK40947.1 Peptide chain release factor 1 [Fimbriiglobus ruber]